MTVARVEFQVFNPDGDNNEAVLPGVAFAMRKDNLAIAGQLPHGLQILQAEKGGQT